jgi:diguanylate cyclase (GGDEF)-like protein
VTAARPGTQTLRTPSGGIRYGRVPQSERQQLAAAERQIDRLLKQNAVLLEETVVLGELLAKAQRFAFHDELTGLPNRRLLQDHFDLAMAQGSRQHTQATLLFLDLDGFKGINDVHGHSTADRLLQQVASRLRACIRSSDTACRYGGDEFVILLPDVSGQDKAVAAIGKVRTQLMLPYSIEGTVIRLTVSIGMATYPIDGEDFLGLIRAADMDMYKEKALMPHPKKNPLIC